MRITNKENFNSNSLIRLKGQEFLNNQRIAGRIAAKTLLKLEDLVKEKTSLSLIELNELAEKFIIESGGIPTFKNYKGFPAGVCISVNKQLVHGIPTDYILKDGDVVSFDLGVTINGAIADTALTIIFGTPKLNRHVDLIKSTNEALMAGIQAISVGKRLGCIGYAISKYAKNKGYSLINNYGGHGIDIADNGDGIPHAQPFVANKADKNEGIRMAAGLSIAIEPMLGFGDPKTMVDKDGWTVYTEDIFSHAEHTVFIHDNYVEIITAR